MWCVGHSMTGINCGDKAMLLIISRELCHKILLPQQGSAVDCYCYVGVLISLRLFLFAAQPKEFFLDMLKKLEQRSHKCVELRGNM
jgi:hypothetical protein